MTLWEANIIMKMISTPTMSVITPFGMVCTLHFLQCTFKNGLLATPYAKTTRPCENYSVMNLKEVTPS